MARPTKLEDTKNNKTTTSEVLDSPSDSSAFLQFANLTEESPKETKFDLDQSVIKTNYNKYGLRDGVNYVFDDLGFIKWADMIDSKYIVVNKGNFEKFGKTAPKDPDGLADKDKLVLLFGFKRIALIRGYRSIRFSNIFAEKDFISLQCEICWRGNYETGFDDFCFTGCGDASAMNTSNFAKKYLTAIAENRAFVRAVRNSLNIPILGQDEVGTDAIEKPTESLVSPSPVNLVQQKLNEQGRSFETLKAKLKGHVKYDSTHWNTADDIPHYMSLGIIGEILTPK